ncbi:MAG: hypothetical protein WC658_01910 [Candidatus Omnitrophota bacterium]
MGREIYADERVEKFCEYMTRVRLKRRDLLKSLFLLSGALFFLGNTENAYGHPPSDIAVTYDSATKTLHAVITHPVSNPERHFINKVDIRLNGQEIIEHRISMQDNNVNQAVSYLIPDVKDGDVISVEAYCNISGKLTKEIKASLN